MVLGRKVKWKISIAALPLKFKGALCNVRVSNLERTKENRDKV